jgi:hypothetical protein
MNTLICPVSTDRVDKTAVRITAILTILSLAAFALTGYPWIAALLVVDYFIRAFTPKRSPFNWTACQIARIAGFEKHMTDKAPKVFAARVGFLFALVISILAFVHPISSVVVALVLMGFNILDGVFNFCVGCVMYTYIIFPVFGNS